MIGRFMRAAEVNTLLHDWTGSHTAEEIEAACSAAGSRRARRQRRAAPAVRAAPVARRVRAATGRRVRATARAVPVPRRSPIDRSNRHPRCPEMRRPRGHLDPTIAVRSEGRAPGERPLAGVRVLDFTAFWSGPFATAWLAAMGADVIKVESVQRPDGIRFSAAVRPSRDAQYFEKSALFHAANLSKRGITLDLSQEAGSRAGPAAHRRVRRRRRELHAPRARRLRLLLRRGARHPARRRDAAAAGVRPHRTVARSPRLRADDGAAHRDGVGHRLRRRTADHRRRCRRPDGRHARRARHRRRARASRPHR